MILLEILEMTTDMQTSYRIIKLTFCGPSDVQKELSIAREVVTEWNIQHGDALATMIKFQHWNTDSTPDMSERGQAVINRQLIDESEIVVAVFWGRFGTPTIFAGSGTEEEIRRSMARDTRVLLYFSLLEAVRAPQNSLQSEKVKAFRQEMFDAGLAATFQNRKAFERDFRTHLAKAIHELLAANKPTQRTGSTAARNKTQQKIVGDGNIQVGGNLSITVRTPAKEVSKYPKNSIGADADMTNYIEYLCDLWVKYMSPVEPNPDAAWARIGKSIKTKFRLRKKTRNHLSAGRFNDLVDFLVGEKLSATPVGKKHLRNGTKICRTFEEFCHGEM
ncbi:MAG: hypothetical protein H7Y36_07035 [Armatimonadetes bacterium]|nr:hypothetical protein [Akkermansiaceae bacterium]